MAKSGPEMRSTHVIFSLVERPFYEKVPGSVKIILQNFKNFSVAVQTWLCGNPNRLQPARLPLQKAAERGSLENPSRAAPVSCRGRGDVGSVRASSRRFSSFLITLTVS